MKIEELEKGCGKCICDDKSREEYFCSYFNGYCPSCQAKLSQAQEDKKKILEIIKKIGQGEEELDISPTWAIDDCPHASRLKEELKQKIGEEM